jgi:hypothetical protein
LHKAQWESAVCQMREEISQVLRLIADWGLNHTNVEEVSCFVRGCSDQDVLSKQAGDSVVGSLPIMIVRDPPQFIFSQMVVSVQKMIGCGLLKKLRAWV